MNKNLLEQLVQARQAQRQMMNMSTDNKNKALQNIAKTLKEHIPDIIIENQKDIENAKKTGMSKAMLDRLLLNEERILGICDDVLKLIHLKDPVGEIVREIKRPNGLLIQQVRIPIGVFGIVYEARPNVTIDITCLCIKSGNVCLLKGGKEAIHSNRILVYYMQKALQDLLPVTSVQLIDYGGREMVDELIRAYGYVDVVVPRGGAGLIQHVVQNATVPVIETGAGNCHLYIDKEADMKKAIDISVNAKIQRPSVCNAIETILVHQDIAEKYLPLLYEQFQNCVEIRGDQSVQKYIPCHQVTKEDYATEYDDYIVAIKVVQDVKEAVGHIAQYSTKHSEAIITENIQTADYFLSHVDSACVYHNASTRFSDGGEFGFGAELGISTQKLHARGPLGLQEMTSYQYKIYGNGQVRE